MSQKYRVRICCKKDVTVSTLWTMCFVEFLDNDEPPPTHLVIGAKFLITALKSWTHKRDVSVIINFTLFTVFFC